jgi:hypothetical protein
MRIIIITARYDRAIDLMRQHGLHPEEVKIISKHEDLPSGLTGIRRNPGIGAVALYANGWRDRPNVDYEVLCSKLSAMGFNRPLKEDR